MTLAAKIKTELSKIGINDVQALYYNPSYQQLFTDETSAVGVYEKGKLTTSGAVSIKTGIYTGRSPKDKYIVNDQKNTQNVWWAGNGSDNHPIDDTTWQHLNALSTKQLSAQALYVMDGFCGANPHNRLAVRLVTEVAWMAHFFKNMFIRPTDEQLQTFKPDWTIMHACKTRCEDYKAYGLNSETFIAFHLAKKMTLIGNTWYGGEIKKGIFSVMNYLLPLQGIGSFHCSANVSDKGDAALFFGLSGTGKTTLSADPKRALIGDDEHMWDNDGVFNLEGGCYAKTIALSKENEPDIYRAISRNALLENVVVDAHGVIDFNDDSKTENTRVSYPIYHIDNIVKPISKGGHPSKIIFLTCDAYGVLPPVAKLTKEQAMYQFLSGYTAKVAGTERGVKEPTACFSACFGQPFLLLHPGEYAKILGDKIAQHEAKTYLVNTGWSGGAYGVGKRMPLKVTRAIIDAILDGSIEQTDDLRFEAFDFAVPEAVLGVPEALLLPKNTWQDKQAYDETLANLIQGFTDNFKRFSSHPFGEMLESFGPKMHENI